MAQLRQLRVDLAGVRLGAPDQSHNQLVNGRLCDGCRYGAWCGHYGCCWRLVDADMAADRAKPAPRQWTEQTAIEAIQEWHARHGAPPKGEDWARGSDGHPSYSQAQRLFGSWNNAIRAAGLTPRRNGKAGW